jgi:hypothetical protein
MPLDDTTFDYVDRLLEVRPILFSERNSPGTRCSNFTARLVRLSSYQGNLSFGVARVECPGHFLDGLWLTFGCLDSAESNFTDRRARRYSIHLGRNEPIEIAPNVPGFSPPHFGGVAQIGAVGLGPIPARYSAISASLRSQLEAVPPSRDGGISYRPCDVVLKDGDRVQRVYIMPEDPYIVVWGIWPEDDSGKRSIRIDDVAVIESSHHRLPQKFAEQLYRAGETSMGGLIFTVVFDDRTRLAIATGGAVDFVDYPPGKTGANIVEVLPHVGADDLNLQQAPQYHWCLYSE